MSGRSRPSLLPIFLVILVDVLGLAIMFPLLPIYAEHYGASPFVVGLLLTSYAACQFVSGPLLGRISDRVGRRPLLIISQIGTFGGFLLLGFAKSLVLIFVARVIDGATAGNISLAQAYIADVTAPEERARAFGMVIGIAFGIGFLIGPALSGYLSQFSLTAPIFLAAGLSATSILATYMLVPSRAPARAPEGDADAVAAPAGGRLSILDLGAYTQYFRRPRLANRLLQFFLFAFAFQTFMSGFALFCERRFTWHGHPFGVREIGYVFGYVGLLSMLWLGKGLGPLVKRFGEPKIILAGFLSAAIAYVGLGESYGVATLLVVATVASFGNSVLRPTITAEVTKEVADHEQGLVLGLTQSLSSVAMITAPLLGTALINARMLTGWALVAAGAVAAGFLVALKGHAQPEPAAAG